MSHFSTLRTKSPMPKSSRSDLRDYSKNKPMSGYNGQRLRADLVAVLEGEYDLGWSRNSDGSFDLIADLWGVARSITRPS